MPLQSVITHTHVCVHVCVYLCLYLYMEKGAHEATSAESPHKSHCSPALHLSGAVSHLGNAGHSSVHTVCHRRARALPELALTSALPGSQSWKGSHVYTHNIQPLHVVSRPLTADHSELLLLSPMHSSPARSPEPGAVSGTS